MEMVNMLQAKSSLSSLVKAIEQREKREIIIARNGRPVAKLVGMDDILVNDQRIGVAKGVFHVPEDIDLYNDAVVKLFFGMAS